MRVDPTLLLLLLLLLWASMAAASDDRGSAVLALVVTVHAANVVVAPAATASHEMGLLPRSRVSVPIASSYAAAAQASNYIATQD